MSSIHQSRTTSRQSALEAVDLEQALAQGRQLRAQAFGTFLRTLFNSAKKERAERTEARTRFSPDCTAAA